MLIGFIQQIVVYLSATVGKGLCSFRRRSRSATRLACLELFGICNISPGLFDLSCTECRFADGWSKPHPYGGAQINNNLLNKTDKHIVLSAYRLL